MHKFEEAKDSSKGFQQWASRMSSSYKVWLRVDTAPLAKTRMGALLVATMELSGAYGFGLLTDFTAMMSTDARQLAKDRKELEMLATKLDELLQPVTVLNWKDVLNSWKALIDLRGKLAVFLVNDPDFTAVAGEAVAGPFGGKRMTYYGRWTYKFEEAARRGALAALVVHDDAGAGR